MYNELTTPSTCAFCAVLLVSCSDSKYNGLLQEVKAQCHTTCRYFWRKLSHSWFISLNSFSCKGNTVSNSFHARVIMLHLRLIHAVLGRTLLPSHLPEQLSDLLSVLGCVDVPQGSWLLLGIIHSPFCHFIHIAFFYGGHDLCRAKGIYIKKKKERTHIQKTASWSSSAGHQTHQGFIAATNSDLERSGTELPSSLLQSHSSPADSVNEHNLSREW